MKYALFYMPPCGAWYVHSHKLYDSFDDAEKAAEKFLPPGTQIAIMHVSPATLDNTAMIL